LINSRLKSTGRGKLVRERTETATSRPDWWRRQRANAADLQPVYQKTSKAICDTCLEQPAAISSNTNRPRDVEADNT